jgi:signal peptidase
MKLRRAWHYVSWAVTITVLAVWVLFLRPTSLGGDATYVVIRGNSMEPTYLTGDLVITRSAQSYGVGDAVAYRVPAGQLGAGTIVIHRITGGDPNTGFVLQGDNNEGEDPWFPRQVDVVGKASLHIPLVGRVTALLHQPIMLGGVAAGLMVMWIVSRPSKKKQTKEAHVAPGGDRPARFSLRRSA